MERHVSANLTAYNKDRTARTDLHPSVSQDNVAAIFSYNYDPGENSVLGAKAVAYKGASGRIDVFFFSQGVGRIGNNVHHRGVFATILDMELKSPEFEGYWRTLKAVAYLFPMDPPEVYEAAAKVFASEPNGREIGRKFVDMVVRSGHWNDILIPMLNVPEQLAKLSALVKQRANHELEAYLLFSWIFAAQGYQFSARRSTAGLVIEHAKMDSSLTSLQKKHAQSASPSLYTAMNAEVMSRISPGLRRFSSIEMPTEFGGI
jgi:hypothetical protein